MSALGKFYLQKCVFQRIRAYAQKCLRRSDFWQKKAKLSIFFLGNARSELSVLVTACWMTCMNTNFILFLNCTIFG